METKKIFFQIKKLNQNIISKLSITDIDKPKETPSPTQMRIIDYIIEHHDEEVLQKELERALGISRATVSDVLGTMEKYGFIKRVQSDVDTRTNKIIIQDKAINTIKSTKDKMNKISVRMTEGITKEDLIIFNKVIDKMIDNLEK
ncbi:MAG: MarR family transcriptional regulator [Bacilli bacterium]|nr:MarR family transcriptional regulator [Bacilli bacterium]